MRHFALLVMLVFASATVGEAAVAPDYAEAGDKKKKKKKAKKKKKEKKKSDKKKAKKKKSDKKKAKKRSAEKLKRVKRRRKRSNNRSTEVDSVEAVYLQPAPLAITVTYAEEPVEEPAEDAAPPTTAMPSAATSLAILNALTEGDSPALFPDLGNKRTVSVFNPAASLHDFLTFYLSSVYGGDGFAHIEGAVFLNFATIPDSTYIITCRARGAWDERDLSIVEIDPTKDYGDEDRYATVGTARLDDTEWEDFAFVHVSSSAAAEYMMYVDYEDGGARSWFFERCDITPVE
jgi:hypothetical protein